jgi:hypothetical protein
MKKRITKAVKPLVLAVMLLCAAASGAFATEGGGGAYTNGAEDFMAGAVPPPGTYFLNYFAWYSADRLNDNKGNSSNPDFKLNVTGNMFRFLHVTDKTLLGANWGMQLFVPLLNVDVTATTPGGKQSDRKFGLGDIIVDPIVLSWHFSKNLHAVAGLDIYIPTGEYDKTRLANTGRNYYTFEPVVGVTWLCDAGYEASAKIMYDINTRNNATDYRSGNEFHTDYTIAKHIGPWSLGVGGYWYQQVTNDEIGASYAGQHMQKGSAIAVGPQLKYDYKNMSFSLKYQMEAETSNRPEGNNLWAKFMYAF